MTGLVETQNWEVEVYQIETTDPVVGGPPDPLTKAGLANIPSQQLANRTLWLKVQFEALSQAVNNIDVSADIQAAIDALVDGAPGALDTLKELADALNDNDDAVAALTAQIGQKLDVASGDYARAVDTVIANFAQIQGGSPKLVLRDDEGSNQSTYSLPTQL